MRITEVIPARHWQNMRTGQTASLYGGLPWRSDAERAEWKIVSAGWTWRKVDGTIGLGRRPAETREEAESIMARANAR